MAGLRGVLDHSLFLVSGASLGGVLAVAETVAVSGAAAGVGSDVGRHGADHGAMAAIDFMRARWTWVPALVLFGIGLWLYAQSSKNFSARQLGGLPELISGHGEQRLVMTGIRARVRHPVYLAHLCEMLAWSIGTGLVVCYGLTAFAWFTGASHDSDGGSGAGSKIR